MLRRKKHHIYKKRQLTLFTINILFFIHPFPYSSCPVFLIWHIWYEYILQVIFPFSSSVPFCFSKVRSKKEGHHSSQILTHPYVCTQMYTYMHKHTMREKRRCHKVKSLPAVWHIRSVTTRVNPAHTLILTHCVYVWVCVYMEVCVLRNAMVRQPITFRLSLSGLKVPNHDCICAEKSKNGKKRSGRLHWPRTTTE